MKLKHFSMLFSIIGILILYFLSKLSAPPLIEIHQIQDYDGKQVSIQGIVTGYHSTGQGSQIIDVQENNFTVAIFVEGELPVEYGDKIQATGQVQKFKDDWEIISEDKRLVKIIEKWQNISFPIWQLAENPARYLDLNINVTGYIESVSNAYFYLVDLEKNHSLIVFYRSSKNITIYPGEKVYVLGKFSFDQDNFRYQLEIYSDKHCIIPLDEE